MNRIVSVGAICVVCLSAWAVSAGDADPQADPRQAKQLEPLRREIDSVVKKYYPDALTTVLHDPVTDTNRIHVDYNTYTILMRYRSKDGSWQEPVKVRGPYVGGIWCDIELRKGRYAGDTAGAEDGATEPGPDFYSHLFAPYSKKLDRHLEVKVRFPGGTPPKFLEQFNALTKDFDSYVGKTTEDGEK